MDVTNSLRNRHDVFLAPCSMRLSPRDHVAFLQAKRMMIWDFVQWDYRLTLPHYSTPFPHAFPLRSVLSLNCHVGQGTVQGSSIRWTALSMELPHTSSLQALGSIVPRAARSCFLCLHPFTRSNLIWLESGRHPTICPDKDAATIAISRYVA